MTDKTARGRFVWHELMTSDSAAAQAFYSKVLGWKPQSESQDPSYTMLSASSGPLVGVGSLENGAAAYWLPYIGTANIEQTVSQATGLGAQIKTEITSLPSGGQYAVLVDPQGVEFGVYASATKPSRETAPKRGEYSWHELATTDGAAAFDFYSSLFGWEKSNEHDMGPDGKYIIFGRNGRELGGIYKKPPEMPAAGWLGYVRVKDAQKTTKKVKSAGGSVRIEPMDVPGGTRIAQFVDPQGAAFAVHVLIEDLQPPAAAPSAAATPEEPPKVAEPEPVVEEEAAPAPARKPAAKKAAGKAAGKQPAKKASAKKSPASKSAKPARAAKSAKRPARKAAAKAGRKKAVKKAAKRAGSKKKAKARKSK